MYDPSTPPERPDKNQKCECTDLGLVDHDIELTHTKDYQFLARFVNEEVELWMDEPEPLGEKKGPEGVTLLAGATGYCMTASLVFALKKLRVEPRNLKTYAKTELKRIENRLRRVSCITIDIHVEIDEKHHKRFEQCLKLFGQYCIIGESIRGNFPIFICVHHPWGVYQREIPVEKRE
jgi:uncharacterized OsmC-like protein